MGVPDADGIRRRLAAGDEEALGEVYDAYAPLVFGLALRVTRSREAAEDVTQEVFAFLWERPLVFDPAKGPLRTWLGTLAHRRAVEVVRREERRRVLSTTCPDGTRAGRSPSGRDRFG